MEQNTPAKTHWFGPNPGARRSGTETHIVAGHVVWMLFANWRFVIVLAAQDAGLIISRKAHGAHHKPPFKGNYCIVSGWWNEVFDGTGFFYALEKRIYDATGVAPRCWSEDEDFAVQEDAPEGWGDGIL